jgi:hypothetical protein
MENKIVLMFKHFPFIKRKWIIYLFLLFMTISLSGCFRSFYNPNTRSSIDTATLSRLISEEKYFIIHYSNGVYGLENAYVKNDSLFGKVISLPWEHIGYLDPDSANTTIRVKLVDKQNALTEVHLYTNNELNNNGSVLAASVPSFNRVDVYELNKKATTGNHIWSVVGIVIGSFFIFILIAVAACDCSFG